MHTKCQECQETVRVKATTCPSCGYNPREEALARGKQQMVEGMVLSITVILSPVGIPRFIQGLLTRRKAKRLTPGQEVA